MGINSFDKDFDRATAKIHRWKANFLDLSTRNPQLKFNPKQTTYLELIHPRSSDIFKLLVIYDQKLIFPPVYQGKKNLEKQKKTRRS